MIDKTQPYPRTMAFVRWAIGDLGDLPQHPRRMFALTLAAGMVGAMIGLLALQLLNPWLVGIFLGLSVAALAWLLRVLAAYARPPWRK